MIWMVLYREKKMLDTIILICFVLKYRDIYFLSEFFISFWKISYWPDSYWWKILIAVIATVPLYSIFFSSRNVQSNVFHCLSTVESMQCTEGWCYSIINHVISFVVIFFTYIEFSKLLKLSSLISSPTPANNL